MSKDLIKAQGEYIKLLEEELQEISGLAILHGWRSSRIEAGKQLRETIEKLQKKEVGSA